MSVWIYSASAAGLAIDGVGANSANIAFGLGRYIVPTSTSGTNAIASTDGGITWSAVAGLATSFPYIAFGAGIFVAGANTEFPNSEILDYATSVDGITWIPRTINLDIVFGITFNHVGNASTIKFVNGAFHLFFRSDNVGASTQMCSSVDGITWTDATAGFVFQPPADNVDIAFGSGKYNIAVDARIYTGATLATLAAQTVLSGSPARNAICFGAGLFIATDDNGSLLHTSPDGSVWTAISVPPDPSPGGPHVTTPINIQFIGGKFYCCVSGNNRFFSSSDSVTWIQELVPSPPGPNFSALSLATNGSSLVGIDPFNSPLSIIYASGSSGIIVPDVIADLLAAGQSDIITATLIVGTIASEYSATVLAGEISAQTPVGSTVVSAGSPVNLVVSLGPSLMDSIWSFSGIISKLTKKLLLHLHRVFDKDTYQQLAFRLQYDGGMTWVIANGFLNTTVTGGSGTNQSIPLPNFTVAGLIALLGALPGYSIPYQDTSAYVQLNALVLIDSNNDINTSNGDHIYGYTNLLWAYLEATGSELGTAQTEISEMLEQMTIPTANNEWIDEHGSYYDVPRNQAELDSAYGPRIISQVLLPRGNNVAIAMAIQSVSPLASRVRVIDSINDPFAIIYNGLINFNGLALFDAGGGGSLYGFFDVDFSYDFSTDPTSRAAYITLIESTVEVFRDAGTELRLIIFRNLNSTMLIISDSFVGNVRIIVYDDFSGLNLRLLENGQVRLLENGDARLLE
jgi:hypothetical protein